MTRSRGLLWLKSGLLLAAFGLAFSAGCGARTGLDPADIGQLLPDAAAPDVCPDLKVSQLRLGAVKQMDLLFVVDSSTSMADKQALLKDAVPPLVSRLANPWCIDGLTGESVPVDGPEAECPQGFGREFAPLEDLHIGVITTSLGSHGGEVCKFAYYADDTPDDHARLLPSVRSGLASYQNLGFLAWDPQGDQIPPGENDLNRLQNDFLAQISAVGDMGCGFEAPLEAWYRFLVDPNPPEQVIQGKCASGVTGCSERIGTDQLVLQQREAFLRPDSVVAIMILSDENDCSIVDTGQGWLVGLFNENGEQFVMPRATSACASDPNSACCRSCAAAADTPAGCISVSADVECQKGERLALMDDNPNLRCFDQKRRFGFDLLYPTARYVTALSETTICPNSIYRDADCSCRSSIARAAAQGQPAPPCTSAETGAAVANPLYSNLSGYAAFARDPSQVFLAGIVGVPWQDLATPETLNDPTKLEYMTAQELAAVDPVTQASRWDLMLGNPALGIAGDPFLVESVDPRSGANPITQQPIMPTSTGSPTATINGHEVENTLRQNLQYSCIFPLQTARDCSVTSDPATRGCNCTPDDENPFGDPLCQAADGATLPYHQYFAKSYPGRRLLQVLRDYGNNSITASICPKIISGSSTDLGLGYRPAVVSLVQRFRCASLDANFDTDPSSSDFGRVPCEVLAVSDGDGGVACDCSVSGRAQPSAEARQEVLRALESQGSCGLDKGVPCESYCMCALNQFSGAPLDTCQTATSFGGPGGGGLTSGWCYVDPAEGFGSIDVVASCPVGNERNVRVLGGATPRENETLYSVCVPKCSEE